MNTDAHTPDLGKKARPLSKPVAPAQFDAFEGAPSCNRAVEIYQTHLDFVSRHVISGTMDPVLSAMKFPQVVATTEAAVDIQGPSDLLSALEGFHAFLKQNGAQDYHRICSKAVFTSEARTEIVGHHTTYILRGGSFAVPPYQNIMRLTLSDGQWLGDGIWSTAAGRDYPILTPEQLNSARQKSPTDQSEGTP